MVLRLNGYTYEEIAQQVRRSPETVRAWFADPLFAAAYDQLVAELIAQTRAILIDAGPLAAMRMRQLLDHRSGMVALGAAKDILDRIGLKPSEKHEISGKNGEELVLTITFDQREDRDDRDSV